MEQNIVIIDSDYEGAKYVIKKLRDVISTMTDDAIYNEISKMNIYKTIYNGRNHLKPYSSTRVGRNNIMYFVKNVRYLNEHLQYNNLPTIEPFRPE